MKFSEYFCIDEKILNEYGAVNISLICDLPLFIDPMLIFQSKDPQYIKLHEDIVKYFCFLAEKSEEGFTDDEIEKYINFSEIKNNWLGFSKSGNEGAGLGLEFSQFLAKNIKSIVHTQGVTQGIHIEKSLLFYKGNGKDKISDMVTNLIFKYLLNYTMEFANRYISVDKIGDFECCAEFDYNLQSYISEIYKLPFIINHKGNPEFVLLTPKNILRKEAPSINAKDFMASTQIIRNSLPNGTLRANIETYIERRVSDYINSLKKKKAKDSVIASIEKNAFLELTKEFPILYDYYIKIKEGEVLSPLAEKEFSNVIEKFITNSDKIIKIFYQNYENDKTLLSFSSKNELINRLKYFKHIIEDCDAYKCLYHDGKRISTEDDLNRLFRFVWYGTIYDTNYDANNGRGEYDVGVSYGAKDKCLAEFKLASNPGLSHVFEQARIYEKANCTDGSIFVVFYFSEKEYNKTVAILTEAHKERFINESIFLIDCRNDNKESGSKIHKL